MAGSFASWWGNYFFFWTLGNHMALIEKNVFCFLHWIKLWLFIINFCKFTFGANLGAEKYIRKYEKKNA